MSNQQNATKRSHCQQCGKNFINDGALQQHKSATQSIRCDCGKPFCYRSHLQLHQVANEHRYCSPCKMFFKDEQSTKQHKYSKTHLDKTQDQKKKSSGKTSEFHCCDCEKDFASEQALDQHTHMKVHDKTHPCPKCKRIFQSKGALANHLASIFHKPLSDLKCPASAKCKGRFSSPSALVQHLESGTCGSGMTRKKLNELVQTNDVDRVISAGPREKDLISSAPQNPESDSDSDSDDGVPIYTPVSSGSLTPILKPKVHDMLNTLFSDNTSRDSLLSGLLTPRSSVDLPDGALISTVSSLFCPLCPPTQKAFVDTRALEMHLASPKHAPKAFHCPTNLFLSPVAGKKGKSAAAVSKQFSTLSGLTQHLESGACKGGKAGLKAAVELLEKRLSEMGFKHQGLLKK
ncbi:hypothetical protein MMC07_007722 [Pseudocyphellaria aurata]|nr:hypothetical protein [Pseudocyphellaria aurata]